MTEWLRWWTANPLGSARAGSNPVLVVSAHVVSVATSVSITGVSKLTAPVA